MERDTAIANAINKFVDCKYAVDNPTEGYDCLNSLLSFYEDLGIEMPHQFEDWSLDNYGKRAVRDPIEAHKTFERFVQTLGEEMPVGQMIRGDLLLFKVKDLGTYAGISLGNGNAFIIFDKGGRVCPLNVFRTFIVQVRRLLR
jgi:hypothetical protein